MCSIWIYRVDLTTAFLLLLSVCIEANVGNSVNLRLVNVVVFLCKCISGDLLEGLFDIYCFLSTGLKVRNVIF